jgi:hypothetical protein
MTTSCPSRLILNSGRRSGSTVTLNWHSDRPQGFVATQVTTCMPTGKQVPGDGEQPTSVPLITVGGGYVTTAQSFEQATTTMFSGQRITGGSPWA